ncbi:aKG-HExxH-type peptide beta-hydroxylase [Streptomyces gilvus]|uniref:aKG-HExxH-type peptide beta-hydroxylase n=1 Tax=Streptomyces gilvus TaxID=2920937 RepID=UPI001F1042A7|nr:HEXXH motif-containing putative peptide modification protein [Streptomyces sp. CME 23]MCH5677629.1 HEXXH motif-containing putative peptide modification protein [Streptomyces sp. CME 23]
MLHLFGAEENLRTITALAFPFIGEGQPVTFPVLKEAYRSFLRTVQPSVPSETGDEPAYIQETRRTLEYLGVFSADSALTDTRYQFGTVNESSVAIETGAQKALAWTQKCADSIARRDEAFAALFPLAMNAVFQAPSGIASGGTTSAALGVLWVDPRDSWDDRDLEEFLIHELNHTLIFLDECRFGLFTSYPELLKQENWVTSAIRKTVRPLDKAYHSAIVAADVLLAREEILGHPDSAILHPLSPAMAQGAMEAIRDISLPPTRDLLTPHALETLDRCRQEVERLTRKNGWPMAVPAGE